MHDDCDLVPAKDEDLDRFGDIASHGFGFPQKDAMPWFERAKLENIRVCKRGNRIIGGLLEVPMGQFFGGKSVSTMGVAGVAIVPEERGRGVGNAMMIAMLREARSRGFALSTLYAATITLYRRSGYERAGARFSITIDPRHLEIARVPEVAIHEVEGTPEALVRLYEASSRRANGYLDRGSYVWDRISKPRSLTTKTFTFTHDGKLEGYVVVGHTTQNGFLTALTVTDLVATTSRVARAILRFLIEYRSVAETVRWHGGPVDVFMNLIPDRHAKVELLDYFMIRIVDVARAMEMRGWPRGASGTLLLDVDDASMPENSGRYAITIENGHASVRMLLEAEVHEGPYAKISERGLVALYTGFVQANVLVQSGWLDATDDACAQLDAWFAGPLPTMRDGF